MCFKIRAHLGKGKEKLKLSPRFDPPRPEGSEIWWHMGIDHVKLRDAQGAEVQHLELQNVVDEMGLCGPDDQPDDHFTPWFCGQEILLNVPSKGIYEIEVVIWFDGENREGDEEDKTSPTGYLTRWSRRG